jgi:hypothetical protein
VLANADQIDAGANYQQGPDSIQLRWGTQVVDALGYGTFSGGSFFAGEGTAAPAVVDGHSLARDAGQSDTNDNAVDFHDRAAPTPGASN